jgi:hypothetical protein
MFGIAASYSHRGYNGYENPIRIPTFYVCADCVETAVILAKEILWTSRDDDYAYKISACRVQ